MTVIRGQSEFEVKHWTKKEEKKLVDLHTEGMLVKDIAFKLKRTIDSCHGKLYKLKLKDAKTRPPLTDEEFNKRYVDFMKRKNNE